MPDTWRLFIALDLPIPIIQHLADAQTWLKSRAPDQVVRWVKPESIHLTLKFLGDVSVAYRKSIQDALAQATAEHHPFTLAASDLGCFPTPRRPRVVWMGVHKDLDALHKLRDTVEAHIAPLGYPTEERPYHPHLTLGRIRRDANRNAAQQLGELLADAPFTEHHAWTVEQVTLFRSELTRHGPAYTPLFHAPLPTEP